MVSLTPLTPADREQFIKDNQEAFNFGALEKETIALKKMIRSFREKP